MRYPHRSAPLGTGRHLCDRCPCSGSLFPPQAAAAFAAVLVLRLHQLNIPDCCNLIEQGLDPATFSLSRIIAIKNSPAFSVRLSFVAATPLPPARSALFPIPRGLSRGLTNSPRTDFACAAMPRNRAPARCKNQRSALVPKYTAADSGHYRYHILRACKPKAKPPRRDTLLSAPGALLFLFHSPWTLPRANQQSVRLLVPALRCRLTGCGARIGRRPLGGTPPLRPRPLLRLPVSAAGGGRLHSCSRPPSVQTKSKAPTAGHAALYPRRATVPFPFPGDSPAL